MRFICRLFHCSENKFFAVLFSGLALVVTTVWLVYSLIALGSTFFTFTNVWNFFIEFLIYGTLLVYNIRNDNRAYTAIILLLFVTLIGSVISVIFDLVGLIQARFAPASLVQLAVMACDILCATFAALAFVQINAYRIGRTFDHKKVRLHLILFAVSVILPSIATFIIFASLGQLQTGWLALLVVLAADFAELLAAVASVFTFNRLIRA